MSNYLTDKSIFDEDTTSKVEDLLKLDLELYKVGMMKFLDQIVL